MKYLMPLYAGTLFVSALLLFSVQPMIGKYLLPLLGGTTSVWNTAMLFFQVLLLAGYTYAHLIAKFIQPRTQIYIHLALFAAAAFSLPLALPDNPDPTGQNPMLWQLGSMIVMVAAPFFMLSSTAPLLQQWFSKTSHTKSSNPYFLYVASNVGSMLALLAYPVVIEPLLNLRGQSLAWTSLYTILGVLLLVCGTVSHFAVTGKTVQPLEDDGPAPAWRLRLKWLLLAFVPSSLMLGVTTFITTDVITIPLFWVIPLALYLLTFIIAFSEKPLLKLRQTRVLQAIAALLILFLMISGQVVVSWTIAVLHLGFFFVTALMCHQELSALRPRVKHLTEFYLIMSLGGALGGLFNSLIAPVLFKLPIEYMIVIVISIFCRYASDPEKSLRLYSHGKDDWKTLIVIGLAIIAAMPMPLSSLLLCAAILTVTLFTCRRHYLLFAVLFSVTALFNPLTSWKAFENVVTLSRNYYGVINVHDEYDMRYMTHGVTNHGGQPLDKDKRFTPFSYYHPKSGLGDVSRTDYMTTKAAKNIAILGLGTGSNACYYNSANRHFDYFEIDPDVVRIAQDPDYFTYLSDCGLDYDMHVGDGRLLIAKMPPRSYDMILIDVFTSDNIPVHILTKNAVEIYRSRLKEDGILLFHISNRFFRLGPELNSIADSLGVASLQKLDVGKNNHLAPGDKTRLRNYANIYFVMSANPDVLKNLKEIDPAWTELPHDDRRPWTDDYANVLRALVLKQ